MSTAVTNMSWQACLYLTHLHWSMKIKAISLTEDNTGTGSYLTLKTLTLCATDWFTKTKQKNFNIDFLKTCTQHWGFSEPIVGGVGALTLTHVNAWTHLTKLLLFCFLSHVHHNLMMTPVRWMGYLVPYIINYKPFETLVHISVQGFWALVQLYGKG